MTPAAATRSKRAAIPVAAPFKVTKKTSKAATKAPKAKKPTKAKTPPSREKVIVYGTSSGTVTPDEIEETPPPAGRVDLQELVAQLAKYQDQQSRRHRYDSRVHKSRSHRHRHRHSDTSDSSDSESDQEGR